MQGLGYTDLVLSVAFDIGFDTAADKVDLRTFALDVNDVGKLAISGAFSNVKVHGMVNGSKDPAKPDEKSKPNLDALTIRFDNAGIVERALDMQAQILGTSRDDVAAQWPMALMFLMGDVGGMEFQQKVQAAVSTFLKTPKSMTITMAPPAPVPFDEMVNTLKADQTKLPSLLAIDITVND